MILAHVNGMRLFLWAKQTKKNAAIEKTLRLSCRLVSVAVCIQKEHRKGCPRKQGLAVVEDEYFVYAGRATARDFLSDADQFSAGARFDIIDGSGQCDSGIKGLEGWFKWNIDIIDILEGYVWLESA